MAQVFQPNANILARLSLLIGAVGLPGLALFGGSLISRTSYNTDVEVPIDQPVPFSHEHHATELGIDCRYCHTSVEVSETAGVPPTQTCMTCHSQIWTNSPLLEPVRESYRTGVPLKWNKVNVLPDFVYFNHSIHVNRGINCNICHGPMQTEPLTYKGHPFFMVWCLNCHRDPAQHVAPREDEFKVYQDYQRGLPPGTPPEEVALATGTDYTRSGEDLARGEALLSKYKMTATLKQLTDCWTCHR